MCVPLPLTSIYQVRAMSILPNLLRSLFLTSVFSFFAPIFLILASLLFFLLVASLPVLNALGQGGIDQLSNFLFIFGTGSPVRGVLTIGAVCSLVGVMFDTYAFYKHSV